MKLKKKILDQKLINKKQKEELKIKLIEEAKNKKMIVYSKFHLNQLTSYYLIKYF